MPQTQEEIGQLIKQLRVAQNMTQTELGEKMGLKKSTVALCEGGKRNLTIETLQRFAAALNGELDITIRTR